MPAVGMFSSWVSASSKQLTGISKSTYRDLLRSLMVSAWYIEARDPYAAGRLWRVYRFAKLLAEALSLPAAEVARVSLGSFLHELGKIGIPDAILKKKVISNAEISIIRTHPEIGWRILVNHPLAELFRNSILSHHERPDGRGYPQGLNDHEIPLEAKIVGICEAFDAMTSAHPYRAAMGRELALGTLLGNRGTQFDSKLCMLFVALARTGLLDKIIGHSDDDIALQKCSGCGPVLTIRREHCDGEFLYCCKCAAEYLLKDKGETGLVAIPTRRLGTPDQCISQVDIALIERILDETFIDLSF